MGKMTIYLWAITWWSWEIAKQKNQETTLHCLETANWAAVPYIIMVRYRTTGKAAAECKGLIFQNSKQQNSFHRQLNKSIGFTLLFVYQTLEISNLIFNIQYKWKGVLPCCYCHTCYLKVLWFPCCKNWGRTAGNSHKEALTPKAAVRWWFCPVPSISFLLLRILRASNSQGTQMLPHLPSTREPLALPVFLWTAVKFCSSIWD